MTTSNDRSMNEELRRGMLDGRERFLRPDTGTRFTEMEHAMELARVLHPVNFGSLGRPDADDALLTDAELRAQLRDRGAHGY